MTLESGRYHPDHSKTVTVWKAPDANGDGAEVWTERFDQHGRPLGRQRVLDDKTGKPVRHYSAPEGFVNYPSFDHTDNYVRVDGRGNIVRDANDEAISLKPGQALVEHSDGTRAYLADEYEQYLFEQAHTRHDEPQGGE